MEIQVSAQQAGSVWELEYRETGENLRALAHVYFLWFTFFMTLLLTAMGWALLAGVDSRGIVVAPVPFFMMYALFAMQLGQAIVASRAVEHDMRRGIEQLSALSASSSASRFGVLFFVPTAYAIAVRHTRITLGVNLIFWSAVFGCVVWSWLTESPIGVKVE